jgi:GxxExxY protein
MPDPCPSKQGASVQVTGLPANRIRRLGSAVRLRLDLVVENRVIVEIKAVEVLLPVHKAQLLTYLRLSGFRVGLLINFNVPLIKSGITRIVL